MKSSKPSARQPRRLDSTRMVWNVQGTLKLDNARVRTIAALMVWSIACVAGIAAAATAGQVPSSTKRSTDASARAEWRITFQVSGGLTGMVRHLELESSGALKATDRRRGTQVSGRLPEAELTQISSLVTKLEIGSVVTDSKCRDCLQYDVTVRESDRSLGFRLNDMTLPGAGPEQLIRALTSLVNRELTEPRPPKERDPDAVLPNSDSTSHETHGGRCHPRRIARRRLGVPAGAEPAVAC